MNEEQRQLLESKSKDLQNAYNNTFGTNDGKKILNDLLRNLLVDGDIIAKNYTNDDILASHIQIGLKLAYKYIEDNLPINIINNK
jgi:hypothetical protein